MVEHRIVLTLPGRRYVNRFDGYILAIPAFLFTFEMLLVCGKTNHRLGQRVDWAKRIGLVRQSFPDNQFAMVAGENYQMLAE